MNNLIRLIEFGQSYWLDNLTRAKIRGGELKKRVADEGLRGVTSNPSIFNKAISNTSDYDEQIRQLVTAGKSVREIYEALVVKDVQDACDILRPVFDGSKGVDGFVSLEVSPYLGHDADGSVIEAKRLFKAVDRPNCFIKIPGTDAGVPAIEECLYEGININITLLFSIASYEAVASAYVRAMERRAAEGRPVDGIASVASFFLSRIDVLADQLLGHHIIPEKTAGSAPRPELLLGKAAIASAKLAYVSFKQIFSGERWRKLREKGAKVQRPLWASTSTKDPLYRDVRYVEPLIGSDTVNTMPESTIAAFADHGVIKAGTIEEDVEESRRILDDLRKAGVDIDFVTSQLVNEGIQKFIDPYDTLIRTLANKRLQFLSEKAGRQSVSFGSSESDVSSAFESLDAKQFGCRLFSGDPYLWKSDPDQVKAIRNRLGWLDSMQLFQKRVGEIKDFAAQVKDDGIEHVILLGMGGSSLCPDVAAETFGSAAGWPKMHVLDNTDPAAVAEMESKVDLEKTLFLVSSKSGTTTETISFYKYFYGRVRETAAEKTGSRFVAITDPGTRLAEEAKTRKFRRVFENPADIGGRYSALSYFGLVPMALLGVDIEAVLQSGLQMRNSCDPFVPSDANLGIGLGVVLGVNQRAGRDKVTFVLTKSIARFGSWVEQLLAESTGKDGLGLVPVDGEDLGKPEVYGNDRVFAALHLEDEAESRTQKKLDALEKAGHPVVRIAIKDKLSLGGEFVRWEVATATAAALTGVNAFDEPNVAESKKNTKELLIDWAKKGAFEGGEPLVEQEGLTVYCEQDAEWMFEGSRSSIDEFLTAFFNLASPPDYVAFLAYFMSTPSRDKRLHTIRQKIRELRRTATTIGYGPRYLHSTGQLHKGGPDRGLFVMLTADAPKDRDIPDEDYGFATLQRAQALGDYQSLKDKGRRVIRVHLDGNVEKGLKILAEMLK